MQQLTHRTRAPFTAASSRRQVLCRAQSDVRITKDAVCRRREALIGAGAALVAPLLMVNDASAVEGTATYKVKYLPVDSLSSFQRADQKNEYRERAEKAIKQFLGPADSSACVRLALVQAGSYDVATNTGGANGSVILSNASLDSDLSAVVEKLRKAKAAIDEGDANGAGPISWADLIYLAGKVTTQTSWEELKISRAALKSGGEVIVSQFGNPWPVNLGRIDSDALGPNKVPTASSSVEEITAYLKALGAKPSSGPFAPKAPFWEKPGFLIWTAAAANPEEEEARFAAANPEYAAIKKNYDTSRRTVTRTNYEMDFIAAYNKLNDLGAVFNRDSYLHPQPVLG